MTTKRSKGRYNDCSKKSRSETFRQKKKNEMVTVHGSNRGRKTETKLSVTYGMSVEQGSSVPTRYLATDLTVGTSGNTILHYNEYNRMLNA